MSDNGRIALYARVSTESQTRDHTIASQLAALRERIAADGAMLTDPDHGFVDDGHSGLTPWVWTGGRSGSIRWPCGC